MAKVQRTTTMIGRACTVGKNNQYTNHRQAQSRQLMFLEVPLWSLSAVRDRVAEKTFWLTHPRDLRAGGLTDSLVSHLIRYLTINRRPYGWNR